MVAEAQFAAEQSESGEFVRQGDAFRDGVSADGSTPHPAVAGRSHLYVALACPWASRTVIARHLRGLEETIGLTVVDHVRDERGWVFRAFTARVLRPLSVATSSPAARFSGSARSRRTNAAPSQNDDGMQKAFASLHPVA